MPLYKGENKNSNGRPKRNKIKKSSLLIQTFKRYNPQGVTLNGLQNFFIYNFYSIGYTVDTTLGAILDWILAKGRQAFKHVRAFVKVLANFIDQLADTLLDDLGEPLAIVGAAFAKISEIAHQAKADKNKSLFSEITGFIKSGFANNKHTANAIASYIMPAVSFAIFLVVCNVGLSRQYAMKVISESGDDLGIVSHYDVLQNADKIIENKLVSTNGQEWDFQPSVKIVSLSKKDTVIDERQLSNNILKASTQDIVEATGLYVNGGFVAAVEDATQLNRAITSLKAPYENGDENRTVSFVEEVNVVDGIFFADSVVPDKQLAETVTSEVSGEKTYTLVSGDSPSLIATKNDITLKQLYSLNPGLEGAKNLYPGDVVVVSASVPFLQVKYVDRVVRQVEVPFTTKTEKNNSMTLGSTKVSQAGENGINEQIVDIEYIDGIYQGENVVQTTVIKEPVQKIVQQGTLWNGQVVTGGSGRVMFPVLSGYRISRGFTGQYKYGGHDGIDIAAPYGTPIYASDSGVVTTAVYTSRGYGVYVIINHGGFETLYGHCSRLYVSQGQQVSKGQLIAAVGSTGNSTGNHCHWEVKIGNTRYNPYNYM